MIARSMEEIALKMAGWFPVVSVTGPRQSGKSTLVRKVFSEYDYVNLENIDTREAALADPVGFIRDRPQRLVIDEAQLAPELFNMIQVVSDETGEPGQYILSGSQNFLLLRSITQSLAGRVGLLRLMPLSFAEARAEQGDLGLDDFMRKGGYPRLYDRKIPTRVYYDGYVSTYLERDVAGYLDVRNIRQFETMLRLVAQTAGGLLNITRLAQDASVSSKTAREWLSILESSYIIFLLPPYFANIRKRLVKTPKLYLNDTGLLCHLLGIRSFEQLRDSPMRGAVFKNLIIAESMKQYLNAGVVPKMYFYRDSRGKEVDLVDLTNAPKLVEIKSSRTFRGTFSATLNELASLVPGGVPKECRYVVMRRDDDIVVGDVQVVSAESWLLRCPDVSYR